MANPFDDLVPKGGAQPKGGAFDDLIPAKPPVDRTRNMMGLAGDALAYGATPLFPLLAGARYGLLGEDAKAFVQGDRRHERLGAQGIADSLADTAGIPVDLAAAGMRMVGRGINRAVDQTSTGQGRPDDAPPPGPVTPFGGSQMLRDVITPPAARLAPQDTAERFAYGAGRGAGSAVTGFAPAAMVAQAAPAASATQGVAQALAARPVMQTVAGGVGGGVGEATKNPWLGMAAGAGTAVGADVVSGLARRMIQPSMMLTPGEQRIAQAATERYGIPLTPAQATGSGNLHRVEAALQRLPGSGNMADRQFQRQHEAFNSAALGRAGVTAPRADPGVMDDAFRTLGARYDDLLQQQGGVSFGPSFSQNIDDVVTRYTGTLETDVKDVFRHYVRELEPLVAAARTPGANPQTTAEIYQRIRSDLTTRARQTNNERMQEAILGLRNALDDAATNTRPDLAPAWKELRQQYANLETINKVMRGASGAEAAKGNIPYARFRQAVAGDDPQGFARGRGDMNELAQVAGFLQSRVPNSGTTERAIYSTGVVGGLFAEPHTAVAAALTPALVQAAYSSAPVRQMLSTRPAPMMQGTGGVVEALMLQQLRDQLGGALAPR